MYIPIPEMGAELDRLVQIVRAMMDLRKNVLKQERILTELRSRLISDVVTGKINVQDIEIPEYEFVGEEADADADGRGEEEEGNVTLE